MSKTQLTQPTPKTVGKQADARICSITCLTRSAAFEGAGRLAPYLVQFNSKWAKIFRQHSWGVVLL